MCVRRRRCTRFFDFKLFSSLQFYFNAIPFFFFCCCSVRAFLFSVRFHFFHELFLFFAL